MKSSPDGADIFLGEGKRPIGATPVTLPINLTGIASVKLRLKKAGYDDYEQIVVDDTPLSINLTTTGSPPPTPAPGIAPGAPAPDQPGGSGKSTGSTGKSSSSRHRKPKPATTTGAPSDEPAGEITE